jgi:hypothetical protein
MTPVNYVGDMSTTHSARSSAGSTGPVEIKIEHRLFSFITINWRGRPLTTMRTIIELIGATTSRTGLTVRAEWDDAVYPTGTKITDKQLFALPIRPDEWHGEWNYVVATQPPPETSK